MSKLTLFVLLAAMTSAAYAEEGGRPNVFEIFVGGTHQDDDNEFSVGATYERRLDEKIGLGLTAEYTKAREYVVIVPLFWHPAEPWRFLLAPGTEIDDGENEFLVRVGGSYEFGFPGWSLSPELNVDYVDDDFALVVGVSFGWKF